MPNFKSIFLQPLAGLVVTSRVAMMDSIGTVNVFVSNPVTGLSADVTHPASARLSHTVHIELRHATDANAAIPNKIQFAG